MKSSERGSALMWWVIILTVLVLVSSVLAYLQFQEKERYIEFYTNSQAEVKRRDADIADRAQDLVAIYNKVGWTGGEFASGAKTDLSLVDERLKALREKFPTQIVASDTTLEAALKGVEAAFDDTQNRLKDATSALEVAQGDAEKAKELTRSVGTEKDAEIGKLSASIKEEQDRGARNQQASTQTIESLRNRITELEGETQKTEAERKKERNSLENQVLAEKAKVQEINERNKMIREHDVPDGAIIDASASIGLAWINAGTRQGLMRGTKFLVYDLGKGGEKRPKGWIEVREVRSDSAVCGITSMKDSLDPIVAGDLIANPYFDRDKQPVFVFLGDLPGRYSKDEVTRMLQAKGARVDDQVSAMTDFLVIGQSPKSETPVILEDSPTFKLAEEYGIQMMAASDLQKYIEY